MLTEFIELERIEHGAKREVLELVDPPWEDHLKMLVARLKNKLKMMKSSAMELRGNLVKLREDIVLIVSWQNFLKQQKLLSQLSF